MFVSVCDAVVSCDSTGDRREPVIRSAKKVLQNPKVLARESQPQGLSKLKIFEQRPTIPKTPKENALKLKVRHKLLLPQYKWKVSVILNSLRVS
jgi:hypothetical protein